MSYSSIRMNITVGVLFHDHTWVERDYTNLEVEFNTLEVHPTNGDIYEAGAAAASAEPSLLEVIGYAILNSEEIDPDGTAELTIANIEALFESDANSDPEVSSDE